LEKGTMIQKEQIGRRINIIVLAHVDNDQVDKIISILDQYNIKSKILFNHYGRPNKCKKMLDAWFGKYSEDNLNNKFERADENLEETARIIKNKFKRADKLLFNETKE